jgi:hypothetical protein
MYMPKIAAIFEHPMTALDIIVIAALSRSC